jgi:hypothetical protein
VGNQLYRDCQHGRELNGPRFDSKDIAAELEVVRAAESGIANGARVK